MSYQSGNVFFNGMYNCSYGKKNGLYMVVTLSSIM